VNFDDHSDRIETIEVRDRRGTVLGTCEAEVQYGKMLTGWWALGPFEAWEVLRPGDDLPYVTLPDHMIQHLGRVPNFNKANQ
jgi:hypothetical protein